MIRALMLATAILTAAPTLAAGPKASVKVESIKPYGPNRVVLFTVTNPSDQELKSVSVSCGGYAADKTPVGTVESGVSGVPANSSVIGEGYILDKAIETLDCRVSDVN